MKRVKRERFEYIWNLFVALGVCPILSALTWIFTNNEVGFEAGMIGYFFSGVFACFTFITLITIIQEFILRRWLLYRKKKKWTPES